MNLLMLIYQGVVRPTASRYENGFENFNEFMVLITTESLFFQTDWIPSHEFQYTLGWITIGLTCFTFIINLGHVIYYAIYEAKLLLKK